ncbi:MAG: membrane protein [Sulfuricurvum sp. PC08-66]|nr:MAG: membrane protein [Sulfuricurvum sp. PC08-66]
MDYSLLFMFVGFVLASYSIIANDAIQTLGTFIGSNRTQPWYILWGYSASILLAVLFYGWYAYGGDVSYGRLEKFPVPDSFSFIYIIPPLVVLILTRFGIPVSTTFIVLTVFAPSVLDSMLFKSIMGYMVAFVFGYFIYRYVAATLEQHYHKTRDFPPKRFWYYLQWASTAFLWSQWLVQDLANIFIYMPQRSISLDYLLGASVILVLTLGLVFYFKGGTIQKVVSIKTNTSDVRVATIIDFIYAFILLAFKEYSNIPMSTTWVFIGLLAGREFAISYIMEHVTRAHSFKLIMQDIGKATIGLLISIVLALSIPALL